MPSSPAHADVALLSILKVGLNSLFATAFAYSLKWRFSYNMTKTLYLRWGKDNSPHIMITFGGNELKPKTEGKHMGVIQMKEVCAKRIGKGKQALYAGLGLGSRSVRTSPNTLSRVYWSISIPKMLYGVEVTPLSDEDVSDLEQAHRQNAIMVQGLPTTVPKPAPLALLGWQTIESFIAYLKIMFMIRTLCLDNQNVYRKLMIIGMEQTGEQKIVT